MRFFKRLTKEEKSILAYLQRNMAKFAETYNYSVHISDGAGLDKKITEIGLNNLVNKKFVIMKPNDDKDSKNHTTFGNQYRLIYKGILYKFTDRWTILTSIGITITTISAIIIMIVTIYQLFNNPV